MGHRLLTALTMLATTILALGLASFASADAGTAVTAGYVPPARMEGNLDSWVALAIVVGSLITAWAISFSAPAVRVCGTLLAASGCLAIAAWFFYFVVNSGFLENPKPNQTPMDSAKPALLWMQALIALSAGVFLMLVARRQASSSETLSLTAANTEGGYGRVSRLLHWSTAGLFLALIPMGIFASMIPEGTEYRNAYYVVHKTLGVMAFLLLLIRLVWNQLSRRPTLDASLTPHERKLAGAVHKLLYFMMIALPVTGFVMTSLHGYPTYFFAWELAPLWPESDAYILWGALHKYLLPYLIYIILGAHILGALKHQFIDKHDSAFKRMGS